MYVKLSRDQIFRMLSAEAVVKYVLSAPLYLWHSTQNQIAVTCTLLVSRWQFVSVPEDPGKITLLALVALR